MARHRQERLEFRYYDIPGSGYMLALQGEEWARAYRDDKCQHFHNYMEIGYCHEGEGRLTLNSQEYTYFADMFSVIPANCPHGTVSLGNKCSRWSYLFVDSDRFLQDLYGERPRLMTEISREVNASVFLRNCQDEPALAGIILRLLEEERNREKYYTERIRGLLILFFTELARMAPGQKRESGGDSFGREIQSGIGNALHYIGVHYAEPIRMGVLADECNLSETHFRRVFREVMGTSPLEYINYVRIQTACNIIERTNDSIADIAIKTGFNSLSAFERNFKKVMKATPTQWRNRKDNFHGKSGNFYVSLEKGHRPAAEFAQERTESGR